MKFTSHGLRDGPADFSVKGAVRYFVKKYRAKILVPKEFMHTATAEKKFTLAQCSGKNFPRKKLLVHERGKKFVRRPNHVSPLMSKGQPLNALA